VTFTVDADGLLSVRAQEQISGVEAQIDVKPTYGLSDDQIAQMLKDSFSTAQADMQARAIAEARLDAERLLLATRTALAADADLLNGGERARIDAAIGLLEAGATITDPAEIERLSKSLADATEAFAAQRMNRGIAQALAGKNIENV
jgi:molecular chaperone HscA